MSGSNQGAKTRQLANANAPEVKKQCGKCPFAKEYDLVERQFVLVDREGKAHTLNGYVRGGGNWLDGMLSILKQNGAVAEKIYLPGCGWGISPAVLKDGTVIQNPHGYFDGILPVAALGGDRTELNFANIRIENQKVVVKDEAPKCPVGNSLVDTEGLVFGKGEYGELNPDSGLISWGSINPVGLPMRQLLERAPAHLLPHIGQGLAIIPNHIACLPQNPLVGARGYDAIAFRKMEAVESVSVAEHESAGAQTAPAVSCAHPLQENVLRPVAHDGNPHVQEMRIEEIRIAGVRNEPEGREEAKCTEEKPAVVLVKHSLPAELPLLETKVESPFGEKAVRKADAPGEEGKPGERNEAAHKGTGRNAELPGRNNVGRADIPVDSPRFAMHEAGAQKAERRVDFTNCKVWIPGMARIMKRRKAKKGGVPKELHQGKAAPVEARKCGRKAIHGKIVPEVEMPGQKRERRHRALATGIKVAKAKRAKGNKKKRFTEETRMRKTGQEKRAKGKRAVMAAERGKRRDYAEKYLLMKKPGKQKKRNWLSISKR